MKKKSRTYNSIVNSLFGIISSSITVILNFAVRVILVQYLGEEVNGLHNLFQNITNVMALMEMGISSAMIIHLYEPIKRENRDSIKAIMAFYKKIYIYISLIFTFFCILLDIFFLDEIITTTISIQKIRGYFLLFILSFSLNYFTYYKQSLLFAEQKNRINIGVMTICQIIYRTIAMVLMVKCRSYSVFLILMILEKVTINIICAHYVNIYHPYLKNYKGAVLPRRKKIEIFNTVKPLFINQMATTIQKSSNSILVSILLGNISVVGYYGNYQLVISTVELLFSQLGSAFTSSFGDLAVDGNKKQMYYVYRKTALIMNTITCIVCAGFLVCIQDFIYIVFGEKFVLDRLSVFILTASMVVSLLNIPIISVQNAMGLHKFDDKIMLIQAGMAIIGGYILGEIGGMTGIFSGLLFPTIIFTLIYKGIVISEVAFEIRKRLYLIFIGKEIAKIACIVIIVYLLSYQIPIQHTVVSLLIKGCISVICSTILLLGVSWKDDIFRDIISNIYRTIKKI